MILLAQPMCLRKPLSDLVYGKCLTCTRASLRWIFLAITSLVYTSGYCERINASSKVSNCIWVKVVLWRRFVPLASSVEPLPISFPRFLFPYSIVQEKGTQRTDNSTIISPSKVTEIPKQRHAVINANFICLRWHISGRVNFPQVKICRALSVVLNKRKLFFTGHKKWMTRKGNFISPLSDFRQVVTFKN